MTAHTFVPGYQVTREGLVFSVGHNWRGYGPRLLTQTLNYHGYPSVRVTVDGKRRRLAVHTLVALAFVGPRPSLQHEVRHLDGDRTNNRHWNLFWGTRLENAADRERHGRTSRGAKHGHAIRQSSHGIVCRTRAWTKANTP